MCTIPDADVLIRRVRDLPGDETLFGNKFYHVNFKPESKVGSRRPVLPVGSRLSLCCGRRGVCVHVLRAVRGVGFRM